MRFANAIDLAPQTAVAVFPRLRRSKAGCASCNCNDKGRNIQFSSDSPGPILFRSDQAMREVVWTAASETTHAEGDSGRNSTSGEVGVSRSRLDLSEAKARSTLNSRIGSCGSGFPLGAQIHVSSCDCLLPNFVEKPEKLGASKTLPNPMTSDFSRSMPSTIGCCGFWRISRRTSGPSHLIYSAASQGPQNCDPRRKKGFSTESAVSIHSRTLYPSCRFWFGSADVNPARHFACFSKIFSLFPEFLFPVPICREFGLNPLILRKIWIAKSALGDDFYALSRYLPGLQGNWPTEALSGHSFQHQHSLRFQPITALSKKRRRIA